MANDRAKLASDYSLVITSIDPLKGPWSWQIERKSRPLGVKFYRNDFKSQSVAKIDGEKALKDFLDRLCREG